MGNFQSSLIEIQINYQDIQKIINLDEYLLINTLDEENQNCLIQKTINYKDENNIINNLIKQNNKEIKIIIYGKNCNDISVYLKYKQLKSFGFSNIYIYQGGLFEWLLLQDIYGSTFFPTTQNELNLLKYKSKRVL